MTAAASAWRPCHSSASAKTRTAVVPPPASTAARARRSVSSWSKRAAAWLAAFSSKSGWVATPASSCQVPTRSKSSRRRRGPASKAAASRSATERARLTGRVARSTSPCSGWARRARMRRPDRSNTSRPLCSAAWTARMSTSIWSTPTGRGSPQAASSTVALAVSARVSRRAATNSASRVAPASPPVQRHTPSTWCSAPVSHPPRTNSRKYSGFPSDTRSISCLVSPSTGPPRARPSSSAVASGANAGRSRRRARPSFHSAITESGAGAPVRTVTSSTARPRRMRRCISAAEASSSR
jgi:hypothetical protein